MLSTPTKSSSLDIDMLILDTAKICSSCGLVVSAFYCAKKNSSKIICPDCKYRLFPPNLVLQILVSKLFPKGQLYNPFSRLHENVFNIDDFIMCGWFIRKRIIYEGPDEYTLLQCESRWTNYVREIIQLEYYGDRVCKRTPDYLFFPDKQQVCNSVYCSAKCSY